MDTPGSTSLQPHTPGVCGQGTVTVTVYGLTDRQCGQGPAPRRAFLAHSSRLLAQGCREADLGDLQAPIGAGRQGPRALSSAIYRPLRGQRAGRHHLRQPRRCGLASGQRTQAWGRHPLTLSSPRRKPVPCRGWANGGPEECPVHRCLPRRALAGSSLGAAWQGAHSFPKGPSFLGSPPGPGPQQLHPKI